MKLLRDSVETMVNRVFFTVLIGIVLSSMLTNWLGQGERNRAFHRMRANRDVDRIEQYVQLLEASPPDFRHILIEKAPKLGLSVGHVGGHHQHHGQTEPTGPEALQTDPPAGPGEDALTNLLDERLGPDYHVSRGPLGGVNLQLSDGTPLTLELPRPARPEGGPSASFWFYQFLFLLCIVVIAYYVARMTTSPLRKLADAARELGRNLDREPLAEDGPREIRHAAQAFNMMQSRLRNYVRQRNQMLAAISHDLQTPLTRLRLRLEKVHDDELKQKLLADLSAMQALVAEGLDLARSVESQEKMVPMDISSLLDSVCQDAVDAGSPVDLQTPPQLYLPARPNDLRRCLTNLIDNAVKYGKVAHVSAERGTGEVFIRVADEGPGIPEDKLTTVFDPFVRLEESRSRHTGGSGVGLTIARNIAERHGGELVLRNRPKGAGLEAVLRLPCPKRP